MIKEPRLPLFDLAICISDACDLVSTALSNHHKQVAYIAFRIGKEMGLGSGRLSDLVLAGTMHDIGALSLGERVQLMTFETTETAPHEEIGYSLLSRFKPAQNIAEIIRNHHHYWNWGDAAADVQGVPRLESDIIHLADRVALQIDPRKEVLGQGRRSDSV